MNAIPPVAPGRAAVASAHLVWDSHGRLSAVRADGVAARAGDGVAVAITEILRSGQSDDPNLRVRMTSPLPALADRERAVGDDVDMTNWNVIVDNKVIVKIVGRLGDGDRAVRLVQAVSTHAPAVVPVLHGTLELRVQENEWTVVATVTELVRHAEDGWTWAVDDLLTHRKGGPEPAWPREAGALIATMHAALHQETRTSSGIDPAPSLTREAEAQLDTLTRSGTVVGLRLAARREALLAAMHGIPPATTGRFAVHGDLHVGQLLRANGGMIQVIDFDGDPQGGASVDAADAAVDLAHLLVSIDLVGAIAVKRCGVDDLHIVRWCTTARVELISAYQEQARLLEHTPGIDVDRIAGLEAVQYIRELTYSRDYLPRWMYAPDWAITHRYPPRIDVEDPPWTPPFSLAT